MLKQMFAMVGILALSAGLVEAQDKKLKPDRLVGGTVEKLQKELELTGEQVTQVESIMEDLQVKLEDADRSEIRDLATGARNSISEVLSEDQNKKYTEMNAKGKKGDRKGRGFLSIDSLTEQLSLTAEQVDAIGPILKDAKQDVGETNKEMKKEGAERSEIQKEVRMVMNEYVKVIKDELTEEQAAKLDEMIASRPQPKKNNRNRNKNKKGQEGDTPTGRPQDQQQRRRPDVKATVAKLGLGEEEAASLIRNLETIQNMRREVGAWNRDITKDLKELLDNGATDEEIEAKMTEINEKRQEKHQEIRSLTEETYGSLTASQKARLMVEGVR
jgi:hypothetical protein